jgi:signal transduction histidine kinase
LILLVFALGYLYGSYAFPDYYQQVELNRLSDLMAAFEALEAESETVPLEAWENLALQSDALVMISDAEGNLIYWKGTAGQGMQAAKGQGQGHGRWDQTSGNDEFQGVTSFSNLPGEWLVASHRTAEGSNILLQRPMGEVEAAVAAFLTFLQRIFILGMVLGIVAAWFVSRNLSRPIVRLNQQAKAMARLDFQERFTEIRTDEIGELGTSVNELSRQLAETIDQLQAELAKEKNLESMRKNFVAKVSHELQTPLAVIQSYVEGLEDGLPAGQAERHEYYQVIGQEIQTLSRMARDLTDLSQLESGAFRMKKEDISLDEWMGGIAERFLRLVGDERVFVTVNECKGLALRADRQRLTQAVFNLLNNARRHAGPEGRIRFGVKASGQMVEIAVWNQGDPVDPGDLDYLWQGFYRGKREESRGMGLGLAIVDQIVKAHGGERLVENHENGVLFTLRFPR